MNNLGGSILILVMAVVLLGSARWAVMGMMAGMLFLPISQSLQVFGVNLFAMRFVEIAAVARIVFKKEFSLFIWNGIDRVFVLVYAYTILVYLGRSTDGIANLIGAAVDAHLCYFAFRVLIRDFEDFKSFLRTFVLLLGPFTVLVLIETFQGQHIFAGMGLNSPEMMREGRIRSIGSFDHPSLLGTLGASFMQIYIGLWCARINRLYAFIGIMLCATIVWASNSGGPISCVLYGWLGWILWFNRKNMQWFRRGLVAALCLVALIMKAPIWFLIAKLGAITGGDSWHRAAVIDKFYQHLDEWWLVGMPIEGTKYWLATYNPTVGGIDLTNNYLALGLTAGLGAIALYILLLVRGFSYIGNALLIVRNNGESDKSFEFLLWGLGVIHTVHILNWLAITYYDQTYVFWLLQLAVLSTLSDMIIRSGSKFSTINPCTRVSQKKIQSYRHLPRTTN